MTPLAVIVPGPLDQLTGGYLFDRHVVDGLRDAGRRVDVVELAGRFPDADDVARDAARAALAALPDGAAVVIDGLALPGFAACLDRESKRLGIIIFVHHPLADETGLSEAEKKRVATLEARLLLLARGVLCPSDARASSSSALPRSRRGKAISSWWRR